MTDDDGTKYTDNAATRRLVSNYFQNIFTTEMDGNTVDWDSSFSGFPVRIHSQFYEDMSHDHTTEEVKIAVFQLNRPKLQVEMVSLLFSFRNFGGI